MPKTVSAQAIIQKALDGVNMVWLVDSTLDEFGLSTQEKNWGSRVYSVGVNTYEDIFTPGGISFGRSQLRPQGGIATVGRMTMSVVDLGNESEIADTFVLLNDDVIAYQIFNNGAEVLSDRFEIFRGVIERHDAGRGLWRITVKDDSKKLLRDFPTLTLDPVTYPGAYTPGRVFPFPFGNLNHGPDDGDGLTAVLAPSVVTNRLGGPEASSGLRNLSQSTVYQWYETAKRLAEVLSVTLNADGTYDVSNPTRKLVTRPLLDVSTNDVTDWEDATDGDLTTSALLVSGDNLDVFMSGSDKLGRMTSISIEVATIGDTGSWTYTVRDDTTIKNGPTAVTGDESIALTLTDWDTWELALMNILIDGPGSGDVEISDIKLVVNFDDFSSFEDVTPRLWQSVSGYADDVDNYEDGAVIVYDQQVLRNPVYQLEALFRDSDLTGLATARIVNGWPTAATSRTSWKFDWFLSERSNSAFFDDFCFQAGLHLFPEEGGFSIAALDKTRSPSHFWSGNYHSPAINGTNRDRSRWQNDLSIRPVDASAIINEFHLRYRLHGPSGDFKQAKTASGQFRFSSTATLTAAGILTDPAGDFVNRNVLVDERIYFSGDVDYKVVTRDSATQLTVVAVDGGAPSTITTATTYYLGPNVDGLMVVSQLSYKSVKALGQRQVDFEDDGGFKSRFITDDATADLLIDHVKEWFAVPRDQIEFPVPWTAIDVSLGDVFMMEHPKLRASKRPVALSTVDGVHGTGATVISVAAGTAGLFRADDFVMIVNPNTFQPEIVTVSSTDLVAETITVVRARLQTTSLRFQDGWIMSRVTTKWMVTALRPMTPSDPVIRLQAIQMPPDYLPVGRVVITGFPGYTAATDIQRVQSGWATLRNGKVQDLDADSNISHVGPDSGTYVIT